MCVLRHSELQTLEVQSEEAQELVSEEGVVEKLGGKTSEHQRPHRPTIHCSHLAYTLKYRLSVLKKTLQVTRVTED